MAGQQLPNNTITWSNLFDNLKEISEVLGKEKSKTAAEQCKNLTDIGNSMFQMLQTQTAMERESLEKIKQENEQLRKKLEEQERRSKTASVASEEQESDLNLYSDEEEKEVEKVVLKKRKSSVLESNINLMSVAKKKKLNEMINEGQMLNENLTRFSEKENLSSLLATYNDYIPTTPMSDASLRRIVKLLANFEFPSSKNRISSSYKLPMFKTGDNIISHLELVKVFLTQNFREENIAYMDIFMSLSEVPHLKIWANSELMTTQPNWKKAVKMVIDRVVDKNSAKQAISNLLQLEWGISEKPENFISRYINDLTNANQTDNGWTFLTEALYKAMDNHHQDVRRSLQNALSLATNDQRNLDHIKEMFLEIASSFKDAKKVVDEVKFNKNSNSQIRCRFCSRRGHKEKDCFKKNSEAIRDDKKPGKVRCSYCHSRNPKWGLNHDTVDCRFKNGTNKTTSKYLSDLLQTFDINTITSENLEVCEDAAPKLLRVPILVNTRRVMAIVDSGANISCISSNLISELKVETDPEMRKKVKMADGSQILVPIALITLKLRNKEVATIVSVLDMEDEFLLGLDLMNIFGIALANLPYLYPDDERLFLNEKEEINAERTLDGVKRIAPDELEFLLKELKAAIDENSVIPADSTNTHPEGEFNAEFKGQVQAVYVAQYKTSKIVEDAIDAKILHWIERGIIYKRRSKWSFPLLGAPKKDLEGSKTDIRVCWDGRKLNTLLKDSQYTIPLIGKIFTNCGDKKYFSVIDLAEAFHQLPVHAELQPVLSFTWKGTQYCYARCPFGIKTIPAFIQRLMDSILAPFNNFCGCFIDDIVIYSKSIQEHVSHVKLVLGTLTQYNFRIKIEKCKFGYSQVALLGHIVGCGIVKPDASKLNDIWKVGKPKTGKALQSFLGTINYLRSYIPRFSSIAKPLNALRNVKGNLDKMWGPNQEKSFTLLKEILRYRIILNVPDFSKTFYVGTDASNHGIGGVLYQKELVDGGEETRIISVVSKSLSKAQQNYAITKKELWAVVFCLNKFHDWIIGRHFVLETDHQAITYLFKGNHENVVINSWLHILLKYDFDVVHIPGTLHVFPDSLSRLMSEEWMEDGSQEKSSFCKSENILNKVEGKDLRMTPPVASPDLGQAAGSDGLRIQSNESRTYKAGNRRAPSDVRVSYPRVELSRFIKERLDKKTLPEADQLNFIKDVHLALGHCSANILFNEIWNRGYFWSTLFRDCKQTTSTCLDCLRINIKKHGYSAMQSVDANAPFQTISMDWMYINEDVGHKKRILVVKDMCTSFIIMRLMTKFTSSDVASTLLEIFANFGIPQVIKTDAGSEFSSKYFKGLCNELKILKLEGTPHHQQSNPAEASIRELQRIFAKIVPSTDKEHYERYIPIVQMMINSRTHSSHQCKPFELMFTRKFDSTGFQLVSPKPDDPKNWKEHSSEMVNLLFPLVNDKIKDYRSNYKEHFNQNNRIVDDVAPGTLVMIRNHLKRKGRKMDAAFLGPFVVKCRNPFGTYEITTMEGVAHQSRVTRNAIKVIDGKLDDFSKDFEIEKIVRHKKKGGQMFYLVKWLGYNDKHNLWLPTQNLVGLQIFQEYLTKNGLKA